MRRTAASASSTFVSSATDTNSVVISPPAESGSYARRRSVSSRACLGISERISSAVSSSSSSRTSARSSGVICVTSSAACRVLIASRISLRSSSSRYSSTSAARAALNALSKAATRSRGSASATSARSAGCISSVSAGMLPGSESSSSRMSGAISAATTLTSRLPVGVWSGVCRVSFITPLAGCAGRR